MMKVALFFGSFNPIHIGHLALANYMCEFASFDELWFVVSPRNPFKSEADLIDDDIRLDLVRRAISGYSKMKACDVEFSLPVPSYTIHTLDKLKKLYPDADFTVLIGADNWERFPNWYESDRILAEYSVLIYDRPGYEVEVSKLPSTVTFVSDTPTFEISSTFIRNAIKEQKDVRFFLHPAVFRQISQEHLYE